MKQPSLSLAVLFREILPKHAFLVGGKLPTTFHWVRLITTEAEAGSKASAGELVLISPRAYSDYPDPDRILTQIIARLIQTRVAAFAVHGSISLVVLEDALKNEMPVICLPDDASMENIERATLSLLNEQQSLLERYERDLQQAISRPGNHQQNLISLIQLVAQLIDRPVALHDAHRLRLTHAFPETHMDARLAWYQHRTLLDDDRAMFEVMMPASERYGDLTVMENERILQITLVNDTEAVGYLSIIKDARPFNEITPFVLRRSAQFCGQLVNKYYQLTEEQTSDWISSWLHSPPSNDLLMAARAEQLGFDNEQTYVAMILRLVPQANPAQPRRPYTPAQFTELVISETRARRVNAHIGQYMDRTVVLLPLEQAQHTGRMKQYAESICKRLAEQLGMPVMGGVGRPGLGLGDLRRSVAEAERAQILATQLQYSTLTQFYGDLRMIELLLGVAEIQRLHDFYTDWLSSILDYDQESRSDLLLTMAAYFGNNGNMAATAKQLNVHRNTLVYRLNRIAEITQLDMDDADVQLNLHLAIKAYQLLQTMGLVKS